MNRLQRRGWIAGVSLALAALALPAAAAEAPDALVKRIATEVMDAIKADPAIQAGDTNKIIALVDTKIDAQAQDAESAPAWSASMGGAVDPGELGDLRGGTQVVDNDILVNGRVEDAIADDVLTGSNSVTAGSFSNASGISTVIQNTGANVLIQNAMIVHVKFAGSGP